MTDDNELYPTEATQLTIWESSDEEKRGETRTLAELNEIHNLILHHYKAADLVDQTFVIHGLKRIKSKFEGQEYAYFAICTAENGEQFTTVFGGLAVIELLDRLIEVRNTHAVEVTLRYTDIGSGQGYYTIE